MMDTRRSYNLLLNNCHRFSSGCLSGNYNNPHALLQLLKDEARHHLGANTWRVWETRDGEYLP